MTNVKNKVTFEQAKEYKYFMYKIKDVWSNKCYEYMTCGSCKNTKWNLIQYNRLSLTVCKLSIKCYICLYKEVLFINPNPPDFTIVNTIDI